MVEKMKNFVNDPWKLQAYKTIIGAMTTILLSVIAFSVIRGFAKLDETSVLTNKNTVIVGKVVERMESHEARIQKVEHCSEINKERIIEIKARHEIK